MSFFGHSQENKSSLELNFASKTARGKLIWEFQKMMRNPSEQSFAWSKQYSNVKSMSGPRFNHFFHYLLDLHNLKVTFSILEYFFGILTKVEILLRGGIKLLLKSWSFIGISLSWKFEPNQTWLIFFADMGDSPSFFVKKSRFSFGLAFAWSFIVNKIIHQTCFTSNIKMWNILINGN